VADQLGERAVERARDLLQHQDRGVSDAVLEVGEMALGNTGGDRDRLARQAAARAQQADALAKREQERVLGRRGHTCIIVLDARTQYNYRASPALAWTPAMPSSPESLNFARHL